MSRAWPGSVGVVGAGAMGSAFADGLTRTLPGEIFVVADAMPEAAETLAKRLGAQAATSKEVAACDLVCLAVKPADAEVALRGLSEHLGSRSVLLSVAAGWTLHRIREIVTAAPLVRTMPNLAVRHGTGIVAWAADGLGSDEAIALADLLSGMGAAVQLDEYLFGAATALAGSGPGFAALIAEGMEEGGVAAGLERSQARSMVQAVLAGTGSLLADGGDPAELRRRVSSPGGTTVAGVEVLENGDVRSHVAAAVEAAARRAGEL